MNKAYSVYRFINSDHFIINYNEGEIFTSYSFTSTSRNPFFNPKDNYFGDVLIKINIPKNNKGLCLCVENYSLFPNEQEIILSPGTLKLISVSDDITYYHTDINAQKLIQKKYEFEYIEPLNKLNKLENKTNNNTTIYELPEHFSLISNDPEEKVIEFYRSVPIINEMHYFKLDKYVFQVFYFNKALAYKKYYFILENNPST
jgi:hypothetical protein